MRTIGFLGGMSWESTAEYYRLANTMVRERLGGLHSAQLVLHSVDFAGIEELQRTGRWEEAGAALAGAAAGLERAGADALVLCTNTMHKVADDISAAVSIPLLHIGDVTARAAFAVGCRRIGLLGTAFTMEEPFLRERLRSHGLEVIVPGADDRAEVHRVIYDELCLGVVSPASRDRYREIIGRLVDDGADGIVLGCTEIELLVTGDDSPVPVLATTRLHVSAAVDEMLRDGS